jgi:hypothetical protein
MDENRHRLRAPPAEDGAVPGKLAQCIRKHFPPLGGIEIVPPTREPIRQPPGFNRASRR